MPDYGIDISHWNTVDDFGAVRGHNITFASIKLTEGTTFTDDAAASHVNRARRAGIRAGGYHFARAGNINGQVEHFTNQLQARALTTADSLAPMIDMEADELRGNADAFLREFIPRLRDRAGIRRVLVYANLDWYRNVLHPERWADKDVLLWIARYNGDPGNPGWKHKRLALHQHTNKGRVRGVPGNVDRNITLGRYRLEHLLLDSDTAPKRRPKRKRKPKTKRPATYTVTRGDTLSEIAAQYGTTWQHLARINQLDNPDLIHPGQVLRLRHSSKNKAKTYTVKRGDTLSGIAAQHGTTWQHLARINQLDNPDLIHPGQTIQLP